MDIVLITTGKRPELLTQTMKSLKDNALHEYSLTMVWDGSPYIRDWSLWGDGATPSSFVVNPTPQGASASRNIGASSIPKYRRQEHVMFIDDDTYLLPGWDDHLERAAKALDGQAVLSGHAHPFNQSLGEYRLPGHIQTVILQAAGVLSTVHLLMPWTIWDTVGYFVEPGGPGGSEDVEWCARATKLGYGLAVTDPMCVVHCGLTSSSGQKIVGYDLMMEMNKGLNQTYAAGRIVYG